MSVGDNLKKPFKLLKIPVNKYKDEAIPYHLNLLEVHRETVKQEFGDATKMHAEIATIKRIIAQLKNLLYELDTLRAQVEDSDLDKFDMKTVSLRKTLLQIISEYTELQKQATAAVTSSPKKQSHTADNEESPTAPELKQLQIDANIDDLKLDDREATLRNVEAIQSDIEDLHSTYGTLHHMVNEQKEDVNAVEENVESTQSNVRAGTRYIITAARLNSSIYPVSGALIGSCIGGPIGLVAGLKIGGLAVLSCGLLGYLGGSVLKKRQMDIPRSETADNIVQEDSTSSRSKKDE